MDSTTSASEVEASSEPAQLDESTVDVDADTAAAAAQAELESKNIGTAVGPADKKLEDDEGVEVEKPQDLDEDEGIKVEKPYITSATGKVENMLGNDW